MKLFVKLLGVFAGLVVLASVAVFFAFESKSKKLYSPPQVNIHDDVMKADINHGKRVFVVRAGCAECHGDNLAGKTVIDDPAIGRIIGANITPYKLKDWTDDQVAVAIRYGIGREGRTLRGMPSMDNAGFSRSDIAAMIAYIRSVPAVETQHEANRFGPIAKVMGVLGQMPIVFPAEVIDQSKSFEEKPVEGPTHEFGKYLANSCTGCHGEKFTGGPIPGGDPSWPAAANIRLGQNSIWTEESFRKMLTSGISPISQAELRPPMPVALLKQFNETESKALWLFLSSLK